MKNSWTWLIIPWLLCAAYIFGFHFPAAMDLPNHLARAHILNTCIGSSAPGLCSNYVAQFQPISYFFADYTIMLMLRLIADPIMVGKIALFAMLSINLFGWYFLFQRVRGGINAAYVAGLILIFNNFYYKGFYAYTIGNGAFLFWLAYWWPRREKHSLKSGLCLGLGLVVLYFCHLAAFFSALICYFAFALWTIIHSAQTARLGAIRSYFRDWIFFVAFVGLYGFQQYATGGAIMGHVGMQGMTSGSTTLEWWILKLVRFSYVTFNHSKYFDSAVFVLAILYLLSILNRQSLRDYAKHFWLFCAALFMAAYLVTPDISHGGADVDLRFLLPGYFLMFLGLGCLIEDSRRARFAMGVVVFLQFGLNLSFQFPMQQQLSTMSRALDHVPPGQRLVEVNSRFNFPVGNLSRVNPLSHFSAYYLLRGGFLVDGLINCYMNPNLPYFCYRRPEDATITFKYEFNGLPALNADDIRQLTERFNYILVVEPTAQLVEERLPASQFERVFHEGDVYILKTALAAST